MTRSHSPTETSSGWRWLQIWALVSTGCNALGWGLAATGLLSRTAYGIAGIVLLLWFGLAWQRGDLRIRSLHRRRWRRALPRVFALLLIGSFAGGILYPPNNYDALTYRVPQILHWMTAGRWHWIPTSEAHMNFSCAGQGWLMAPWLAWLQSDRGFFLSNLTALAILPGTFFSVLRRCGVSSRVAWSWMWLLPCAGCYAIQAGGIGNDLLATAYWLAAFAFGLRARQTGQVRSLWLSILLAALATGTKIGVAPLVLPWLLVVFPCWKVALRAPATGLVCLLALSISAAPTAVQNIQYSGHFGGDPENRLKLQVTNPATGLVGNAIELFVGAVAPPVFPGASAANRWLTRLEDSALGQWIRQGFPRFDPEWVDLATEESAGFGLGLTTLLAASLLWKRRRHLPIQPERRAARMITIGTTIALLVFASKVGGEADARLVAPFYPLLLVPFLRLVSPAGYRARGWHWLSIGAAVSILPALILLPARPLWPAVRMVTALAKKYPEKPVIQRVALVYTTYAQRHDYLAPLKEFIPAGVQRIGFIPTENDIEAVYWKPYGRWTAVEVLAASKTDPIIESLRGSVILTSPRALKERFGLSSEALTVAIGGKVVATRTLVQKARFGPEEWIVVAVE